MLSSTIIIITDTIRGLAGSVTTEMLYIDVKRDEKKIKKKSDLAKSLYDYSRDDQPMS